MPIKDKEKRRENHRRYMKERYANDEAYREKQKQRTYDNKQSKIFEARVFVYDYLKINSCVDCNEADPIVLDFDHVIGKKQMGISLMIASGYSITAIKKEISKCVVRCANCHRRKTAKEGNFFRHIQETDLLRGGLETVTSMDS